MNDTISIDNVIIEKIKKEDLSPGDYLVLRLKEQISQEKQIVIQDTLQHIANDFGCKGIVLPEGMQLSILHRFDNMSENDKNVLCKLITEMIKEHKLII